jgi:hypothetical protein
LKFSISFVNSQHKVNQGSMPTFAAFAQRKNWVAAPNVRFLQVVQFSLWAQRKSGFCPMCQTGMSTLGWELPLEAICVNGSFAQ